MEVEYCTIKKGVLKEMVKENHTLKKTNRILSKLKTIIKKSGKNQDLNLFIQSASAYCKIKYEINQNYTDDFIEEYVKSFAFNLKTYEQFITLENTVLFYDGFGLDTRGLALIYLKALAKLGYQVIYVTINSAKNGQPEIDNIICGYNVQKVYIENSNPVEYCLKIKEIIEHFKPSKMFFYSTPNDIAGEIAFSTFKDKITRFQINLTDHAFWCGKNAFDYCIEFRDYGASISKHYRKIDEEKIIKLPFYPFINYKKEFEGFPFVKSEGKKIVFSGGSLYKTLGENNLYYEIVHEVLTKNKNAIFLYAGFGDTTNLEELMKKFPERVYHISERKDLFALMTHIDVYLNTYPMIGGLMTQYAAVAGKIPFILKHDCDAEGILINQKELGIEFENKLDLVNAINLALNNEDYLKKMEYKLKNSVISEDRFQSELNNIIKNNSTSYNIDFSKIDTQAFLKTSLDRLSFENVLGAFNFRKNKLLILFFPLAFFTFACKKVLAKITSYKNAV